MVVKRITVLVTINDQDWRDLDEDQRDELQDDATDAMVIACDALTATLRDECGLDSISARIA